MIERAEIEAVAQELSVLPTDVERDYVNGWMLAGVAQTTPGRTRARGGGRARGVPE